MGPLTRRDSRVLVWLCVVEDHLAVLKQLGALESVWPTLITPIPPNSKIGVVEDKKRVPAWWRSLLPPYARPDEKKFCDVNCVEGCLTLTEILRTSKVVDGALPLRRLRLQRLTIALGSGNDPRKDLGVDRHTVRGEICVRPNRNTQ